MPEGPEVRREADSLSDALTGQSATTVEFGLERLKPFEARLTGRLVEGVTSRGKAMLVTFSVGLTLYSHNQLYGKWFVRTGNGLPRTGRTLRVAIRTDTHSALLYSASDIDVLTDAELASHPYLAKLGPDILAERLRPATIAKRLDSRTFRRRRLGGLFLDQSFLAGVGNYLRSEILFEARLHPDFRPIDLEDAERRELGKAVRLISRRAYQTGGVTVPGRLYERYRREGDHRRHARFNVFARAGRPCRRCGTEVEKVEVAGRRLYLCPLCQAKHD